MISLFLAATVFVASDSTPVDFDSQVLPVLTRAGCNAGACHGSAAGRGEFKLSLYGGSPDRDIEAIALDLEGRRINLHDVEKSLLLRKPVGELGHGGGDVIEPDGPAWKILHRWISEGAVRRNSDPLRDVLLIPDQFVVAPGGTVELKAVAEFQSGKRRDVTPLTVFSTADASAVEVESSGKATVLRRGRHLVIARYMDYVKPVELMVPFTDEPIPAIPLSDQFIDSFINERLRLLKIPPSPVVGDSGFLRRVTLDLTGRLPSRAKVADFTASREPDKRFQLVDELLASDEFTEYWSFVFSKLLRIRSQPNSDQAARTYHAWVRKCIAESRPYDRMAIDLLTAEGSVTDQGPPNFFITVAGPREQVEFVSELFLGVRLRCANCHNHPLDRWTQDDYHGLAAVFARVQRGERVRELKTGEVIHPATGEPAVPRIPGTRYISEADGHRGLVAEWLTSSDNPWFCRAIVNRLWKQMMGRGLVEPTDDFRATNPPTHPDLLNELALDFRNHDYDLRHTLRQICRSDAYARDSRPTESNASDTLFYSHGLIRPLEAEVLADALADVTGVFDSYGDEPPGTRAVALFDSRIPSASLDILGRCDREESCEGSGTVSGGIARKLHVMNGPLLNRALSAPAGRLQRIIQNRASTEEILDEFYELAYSRRPSAAERDFWLDQFATTTNQRELVEMAEDFLWSVLTSSEFTTNH